MASWGSTPQATASSRPIPGEGGRTGVGNLSKDNPNFQPPDEFVLSESSLSAGSQGLHALFQAARLGDPALPDGSAEEERRAIHRRVDPDCDGNVYPRFLCLTLHVETDKVSQPSLPAIRAGAATVKLVCAAAAVPGQM